MGDRTYSEMIDELMDLANDFDVSPFEHHQGMHLRDILEEEKDNLNDVEREMLRKADEIWIKNASKIVEHVSRIWNFDNNELPKENWWWHLSKYVKKEDGNER